MKIILQKKTYLIIAVLLLLAAISLASTKPDDEEIDNVEAVQSYNVSFEIDNV